MLNIEGFHPAALPVIEYNMLDVPVAMDALYCARRDKGMLVWQLEDKSGVSFNAIHAWHAGARSARSGLIVAVAQTLGFNIIMRSKTDVESIFDLQSMSQVLGALDEVRRHRLISTKELRQISGVSMSSFYSWLRQDRDPVLGLLIKLAESLGFEIVMRKAA